MKPQNKRNKATESLFGKLLEIVSKALGPVSDWMEKNVTPQVVYWMIGLVFILPLVYFTQRIVLGPMTSERAKWDSAFTKYSRPIVIKDLPMRGNIYAADGRPIALAGESYILHLDFTHPLLDLIYCDTLKMPQDSLRILRREEERRLLKWQMDLAAQKLADLCGIDTRADRARWEQEFRKRTNGAKLIDRLITYPEWHKLKQQYPFRHLYKVDKPNEIDTPMLFGRLIPAARTDMKYVRINPFDSLARRTIGTLNKEKLSGSQALYGLELQFDTLLIGRSGISHRQKIGGTRANRTIDSVQHGLDLYTSLDMDKQYLVEQTLREQLTRLKAERGTSMLMEVKTGKLLAVVNLERDEKGRYVDGLNHAFSDLSEPGSTIKVASMLIALNDGLIRPDDIVDVGNGTWPIHGKIMSDYNAARGGFGAITASQTIERSSNVGVAKIIYRHYAHNPQLFIDKLNALGFGIDLRSDIPGAARARILGPTINGKRNTDWSEISLPWISHGYSTNIPPIYMLSFFNAIANDGNFMRPYLVTDIRNKEGQLVKHIEPEVLIPQIASPEAIGMIREMMRRVVSEPKGTGRGMRSDIVSIAGKSGTAQIWEEGKGYDGGHNVSFYAYFPSEAPKYSIGVHIRKPSKEFPPAGGAMAAPVIKAISERLVSIETPRELTLSSNPTPQLSTQISGGRKDALSRLAATSGLPHINNNSIEAHDFIFINQDGQERSASSTVAEGHVPMLIGLSATDAAAWLARLGYRSSFRGYGVVIEQSIPAGKPLKRGGSVRLTLGHHTPKIKSSDTQDN